MLTWRRLCPRDLVLPYTHTHTRSYIYTLEHMGNYPAHLYMENCQHVLYFPNLLPLATFCRRADHRLSRRLEPNMHQRQSQYDLSPTNRYMIACVCLFTDATESLCLAFASLPQPLLVPLQLRSATFLITLFTRKLNGNMSSLIKLFFFRLLVYCHPVCYVERVVLDSSVNRA